MDARTLFVGLFVAAAVGACATAPVTGNYATSGGDDVAEAIVNTALAATASGISRANGGCYASCPTGTVCEEESGLCRPLACRGQCKDDEFCDEVTNTCAKGKAQSELGVRRLRDPVPLDYWQRASDPTP